MGAVRVAVHKVRLVSRVGGGVGAVRVAVHEVRLVSCGAGGMGVRGRRAFIIFCPLCHHDLDPVHV